MTDPSPSTPVPPGQHAPFAIITSTDHTAWIMISAWLALAMVVLFAAIRVFIRSTIMTGRLGWDDYLVAIATAITIVHSSLVLAACSDGLGKAKSLLKTDELAWAQKAYYGSNLIYVLGLTTSKAAASFFISNLTPVAVHRKVARFAIYGLTAWGFTYLFVVAFSCGLPNPWNLLSGTCTGWIRRWDVMEAIGCLYEAAVFALVSWLTWGLRTSAGNKMAVLATFSSRLILVVLAGLRLHYLDGPGLTKDPTLHEARFVSWTSAELAYSVVSATMLILRPLVNSLTTHYGGGYAHFNDENIHIRPSHRESRTSIFKLTPERRRTEKDKKPAEDDGPKLYSNYSCGVTAGQGRYSTEACSDIGLQDIPLDVLDCVERRNDSQEMIIRKDVSIKVKRSDQDNSARL